MTGPPRDRRRSWLGRMAGALVLVAAGVVVAFGASPARAAGPRPAAVCLPVPCPTTTLPPPPPTTTTTSTPDTTTTSLPAPTPSTTVPAPGFGATFVPCGSTTGPCSQEPDQVQVRYGAAVPAAVQLSWVATGRAAGAPAPGTVTATLLWGDGTDCGPAARCWQWPAQMTDSAYILDGTYQVTACDTYTQSQCQASSAPVDVGLAVPPGPPTAVRVQPDGTAVVVSWQPPTASPPDLTGYRITRDGRTIWTCSTDGLGPGRGVRCPPSFAVADQPGAGTFTYTVAALRLGVDTTNQKVVSSAEAGGSDGGKVTLTAAAIPGPSGGTGPVGVAGFLPAPVIGGQGTTVALQPVAAPATGATAAPVGSPVPPQNLMYPSDDPVVNRSGMDLQVHPSATRTDVVPVSVLALGLLILAVAAHFLYLRVEVGAVQARLAGARRRQPG